MLLLDSASTAPASRQVRVVEPSHAFLQRCCWEVGLFGCVVVVIGCAVVVAILEGWGPLEATYFTAVTVSTVGFGDRVPTHTVSKAASCLLSVAAVTMFAAILARAQQSAVQRWLAHSVLGQQADTAVRLRSPAARLACTVGLLVPSACVAAMVLHFDDRENFTFGEAVYFSIMTITTIGYGDLVPQTVNGKLLTIVLALMGPLLAGRAVSCVVELYLDSIHVLDHARALRKEALESVEDSFTYRGWEEDEDHVGLVDVSSTAAVQAHPRIRRRDDADIRASADEEARSIIHNAIHVHVHAPSDDTSGLLTSHNRDCGDVDGTGGGNSSGGSGMP